MSEKVQVVCPHCRSINRVPEGRLTDRPNCGQCHAPLFTGHPIALTQADFNLHVLRAGIPLVENGAHLIIINQSETYIDIRADVVLTEDVAITIPGIVQEVLGD